MSEFLTLFVQRNRNPGDDFLKRATDIFVSTMDASEGALGGRAFRLERTLNAAIFDSVSVALARRIASSGQAPDPEQIKSDHDSLLREPAYVEAVTRSTADEQLVKVRMEMAASRFAAR